MGQIKQEKKRKKKKEKIKNKRKEKEIRKIKSGKWRKTGEETE